MLAPMENIATRPDFDSKAESGALSKRQLILNAAAANFCQEGYAGASIDGVEAMAGVSRQTIYNQIGDKEKLFKAVVAELTERSTSDFFAVLETFPSEPKDLEKELTAFAKRLPHARYVEFEDAEHEILMERDDIRARFWREFDAFVAAYAGA